MSRTRKTSQVVRIIDKQQERNAQRMAALIQAGRIEEMFAEINRPRATDTKRPSD